jgi:catechol 2,3-dioxygenase-like lactoylglutathione lyase family enzyme
MRIAAVDHVQLAMPPAGEDRARAFYTGLLGLPEVPKPPLLAARGGCWFENGAVKLHLGVEIGFHPALKAHPGLLVDDLAGFAQLLAAAAVPIEWDGPDHCYIADPFGNRIELVRG